MLEARDDEDFQEIQNDKRIKYTRLPDKIGINAGRAVLLSLVTTEYFVFCDGDFEFHQESKVEKFLEIITETGFDIIGGGMGQNHFSPWQEFGRYEVTKGPDGSCVARQNGDYGTLEQYHGCSVRDIIASFFIARTMTAGTIRFDPLFTQIAHREYFVDDIGQLRIAVW